MEIHGEDNVHKRRNSMATLPEELIMEILLRLPIETLLCLRSVSKSWLSLISSPHFAKAHLLLSATDKDYTHHQIVLNTATDFEYCSLSSLLRDSVTEAFVLDYPGKNAFDLSLQRPVVGSFNRVVNPSCFPRIVGSCNGLVCLSVWTGGDEVSFFLWNPSLRKFKNLPRCDGGEFAPSIFGFGYDDLQDDYKVVCIFPVSSSRDIHRLKVKIYSLKSNSWRYINGLQGLTLLAAPGKLVNGKLYWCGIKIISLDLADEQWAQIVMPQLEYCLSLELGVFGSDLSAMCNYCDGLGMIADVWVMKEYGVKKSWTKMFSVKSPQYGLMISPIFMSNEGEILLWHASSLAKYNPKDNSLKYPTMTNSAPYRKAEIYVKSLVCPF